MQGNQFTVGAGVDVRLSDRGAAEEAGRSAGGKQIRERLDTKVSHCLVHRYIDGEPFPRALSLMKGAKYAVGGVEAGEGVGNGGAGHPRLRRIQVQAKEAA